jgi:hypothetical protein
MPAAYQHLLAISLVQFAVFLALRWGVGARPGSVQIFVLLFASGIPLGLAYDALLGLFGQIFTYPDVGNVPLFLLLNSILSYGSALCTAWLLPCASIAHSTGRIRIAAMLFLSVLIGAVAWFYAADMSSLVRVFLVGALVIVAAELIAMTRGQLGPALAITKGTVAPIVCLMTWSIVIGAIYETANFLFPLWQWNLDSTVPMWIVEILIIAFGYFVLIHPMFVLSRAIFGEPRQVRSAQGK